MGRGSYIASDWAKLKSSKGLVKNQNVEGIFLNKKSEVIYDSRNVKVRESRDSDDSPRSMPIIIGFDVTGSMGYLAKELAVNAVNKTVSTLLGEKLVQNPQIMCSAIGDCKCDVTPLQVTQFEADIRIIRQLCQLHLEGGGGGNGAESYNLLWYFAAHHTVHDNFEKRGEKGVLFTIGDDSCHSELTASEIGRVFADTVPYNLSNRELLTEVQKKYHVVHIHIEKDNARDKEVFEKWHKLMPGYCTVINAKEISLLADLITAIITVLSGKNVNQVLRGIDQQSAEKIARSMAMIETKQKIKKTISF